MDSEEAARRLAEARHYVEKAVRLVDGWWPLAPHDSAKAAALLQHYRDEILALEEDATFEPRDRRLDRLALSARTLMQKTSDVLVCLADTASASVRASNGEEAAAS